jgi:hypothetical protein
MSLSTHRGYTAPKSFFNILTWLSTVWRSKWGKAIRCKFLMHSNHKQTVDVKSFVSGFLSVTFSPYCKPHVSWNSTTWRFSFRDITHDAPSGNCSKYKNANCEKRCSPSILKCCKSGIFYIMPPLGGLHYSKSTKTIYKIILK